MTETVAEGMDMALTDPAKIAGAAESIYDEHYRGEYEQSHNGEYVVIDVTSGEAYLGEYAEDALHNARQKAPHGVFHLMRIGAPGAFKVSYIDRRQSGRQSSAWDWPLRPTR